MCHWNFILNSLYNDWQSPLGVIHKERPHEGGGGGLTNADACANFACKKPNFADVGGGGVKMATFCGRPL